MSENAQPQARFLQACRALKVDQAPVWLMGQAGRYLPQYRSLWERYDMLAMTSTPELTAQVTLLPIDAFAFDAAIIFADVLAPLGGMGLDLALPREGSPRIGNPLSRPYDIDVLATPPAQETMPGTLEAIRLVTAELSSRGIPLIGFAGAPFALATYAVEGGGSKNCAKTKALMLGEPAAWKRLMTKLVTVQVDYLLAQVRAGAAALQVFDSWVGIALNADDYRRYVQPYNHILFERLKEAGVPVIHYSNGTGTYLQDVATCGGDVFGVDWRVPLDWAWQQIGPNRPIQGNLDPVALLAPWRELKHSIDDVLARAGGRPGHIFNLGEEILPTTPVANVQRLVDYVRERTARS